MRALILDFDGLMVDTEWPALEAWRVVYARFGATLAVEDWVKCVGSKYGEAFDPVDHLEAQVGRRLEREALIAERGALKAQAVADAPLMPGVLDRIAEARTLGWAVGVASSSGADWVLGHLDRLNLRAAVDAVRTSDDVERVKPHPDVYLSAAQGLGVAPVDCVVCEDSLNGVRAARAAGMFAVAVPNRVTALLDFSEADLRVVSLTELRLVDRVGSLGLAGSSGSSGSSGTGGTGGTGGTARFDEG